MSSILDKPAVRQVALPITLAQYHELGASGIIDERTELLRGVIVRKMIKSPRHSWIVEKMAATLRACLSDTYVLRQEQPLSFLDSEPEPDLAVVQSSSDEYRHSHPQTAFLVIEAAITSEDLDREKAEIYAAGNVKEYWLVIGEKQLVEKYANPVNGRYTLVETLGFDRTIRSTTIEAVQMDLTVLI